MVKSSANTACSTTERVSTVQKSAFRSSSSCRRTASPQKVATEAGACLRAARGPCLVRHGAMVVRDTVSLRDLPATIADLVGLAAEAPFAGRSLARLWGDSTSSAAEDVRVGDGAISELTVPNPTNPNQGRSPASRGPLASVTDNEYVYIRHENNGHEQLFHERSDPHELVNLAKVESMRPRLERLRALLDQMRSRPHQAAR